MHVSLFTKHAEAAGAGRVQHVPLCAARLHRCSRCLPPQPCPSTAPSGDQLRGALLSAAASAAKRPNTGGSGNKDALSETGNLAFLGDAIWALYVRNYFLLPPKHISKFHLATSKHVTAEQQAHYFDALMASGRLRDREVQQLSRTAAIRGMSFRERFKGPEHQLQYMKATALEALVGRLYLKDPARLQQVMALCLQLIDGKEISNAVLVQSDHDGVEQTAPEFDDCTSGEPLL